MNILLIRPRPHRRSINLQSFMICEPLELEYVSALLESRGHVVEIADMLSDKRRLKKIVHSRDWGLVGLTAYITHVGIVKQYARRIKAWKPQTKIAVSGVHAEVVPDDFVCADIDYILHTSPLCAVADLADRLAKSETVPGGILSEIPKATAFTYPHPDRQKTAAYRAHYNYIYHDRCATVKTSFGCPYACEFCFCTQVSPYFERDIDDVMKELAAVEEHNVFIVDDNFLSSPVRVRLFCQKLDEYGICKHFIAFGRADFIAAHAAEIGLLHAHGFDAFFVGIESFKKGELDSLQKRTTVEQNLKAVRVLEEAGVQCYSGIIVGMDWDRADFDELIAYLNGFKHPMVNIQPITPIPGTPYFDKAKYLLTEKRERYELWDMAHLVMQPQRMSKRRFYFHILRAYIKTAASKRNRVYIRQAYGKRVYRRVRRGAIKVACQYIALILKP